MCAFQASMCAFQASKMSEAGILLDLGADVHAYDDQGSPSMRAPAGSTVGNVRCQFRGLLFVLE